MEKAIWEEERKAPAKDDVERNLENIVQ